MSNHVFSDISTQELAEALAAVVTQRLDNAIKQNFIPQEKDPLQDFIQKKEVRDMKIASSATLWKMEKEGKLKAYGFGGKRYYKRSELFEAFEEVKTKGGSHE